VLALEMNARDNCVSTRKLGHSRGKKNSMDKTIWSWKIMCTRQSTKSDFSRCAEIDALFKFFL